MTNKIEVIDMIQLSLTGNELDLLRKWFESIEDTNNSYLEDEDRALYRKIMKQLNYAKIGKGK